MNNGMRHVRAYMQLVRLPAVFTAMADIFLGFLLTHRLLRPADEFLCLLAASTGLYLAGMAFNDFFDRTVDARERPGRPIPSGRVPPKTAASLGAVLIAVGLGCAWLAGPASAAVAGILTALILAYDGFVKRTPFGPIAMGGCRFLNVMLGASTGLPAWSPPQILVASAMGIYVAGITWFARQEAVKSSRWHLTAATVVIHAGLVSLIAVMLARFLPPYADPNSVPLLRSLVAMAFLVASVEGPVWRAISDPAPPKVQSAVKQLLLAIPLLDAVMVFFATGDPVLAAATAVLVVPAATLGRWIFMT